METDNKGPEENKENTENNQPEENKENTENNQPEENKENKENEEPEVPQNQVEDNPDNFSDQEGDDDFYKIQVENFKNKTSSFFHKNVTIINENGREIKSAYFDFRQKSQKTSEKKNSEKKTNPPKPLILNSSTGKEQQRNLLHKR